MTNTTPSATNAPTDGLREVIGAGLLFAAGTVGTAAVALTGGATVYNQYFNPITGDGLWPIAVGGAILATTLVMLTAMLVLIGVIGSIAWPSVNGYNEYFIAGVAGLTGIAIATGLQLAGPTAALNLLGGPLPENSTMTLSVVAAAIPGGYILGRLTNPDKQPDSLRPQYDPSIPNRSEPRNKSKAIGSPPPIRSTSPPDGESSSTPTNNTNTDTPDQTQGESDLNNKPPESDFSKMEYRWTDETDVSMDDVGGMDELKEELQKDVIVPLTTGRDIAEEMDIPLPNILFHGPPGTGKTFMAKALATELGLPFAKLSGADVQSKWINESPNKISTLFKEARQVAAREGGAVVFLDELDSVLKSRDSMSGHDEDEKVVNEFLNQLQDTSENNILFIGATNRLDSLDEASIRSGRIDKKIHIGKPDKDSRKAIIKTQLAGRPHEITDDQMGTMAAATDGLVAADLERIIVDAARESAFGRGDDQIRWKDVQLVLNDRD